MELAMIGVNYPCEYNQLALHFIAPPFTNLGMFRAPYWYNYDKVFADLNSRKTFGRVVPYEPLGLGEEDLIFKDVERRHKVSLSIRDQNQSGKGKERSKDKMRKKLEKARVGEGHEEEGVKMRM